MLSSTKRSELDFAGRESPTHETADEATEFMAFDLAVDDTIGWAVKVGDAERHELFLIPVQASYLGAA